jgi:hypothetical protein
MLALIDIIGDMKFKAWPRKPDALIQLEELQRDKAKRKEAGFNIEEMTRIETKVCSSEEVVEYMDTMSKTKALNYGNYTWLLAIQKLIHEQDPRQARIDELLMEYREHYREVEVPNLPASHEIIEDKKAQRAAAVEDPYAQRVASMFGGEVMA